MIWGLRRIWGENVSFPNRTTSNLAADSQNFERACAVGLRCALGNIIHVVIVEPTVTKVPVFGRTTQRIHVDEFSKLIILRRWFSYAQTPDQDTSDWLMTWASVQAPGLVEWLQSRRTDSGSNNQNDGVHSQGTAAYRATAVGEARVLS